MMGNMTITLTMHWTIFQLQCFVLLNNHQYNCNITKSFLSVGGDGVICGMSFTSLNIGSWVFIILAAYRHGGRVILL